MWALMRRLLILTDPATRRGQLARSAAWVIALKAVGGALTFASGVLFARLLGAEGYGAYSIVLAWSAVLAVPAAFGLPQYLVREVAKAPSSLRAALRWADRRVAVGGTGAAAVMLVLAGLEATPAAQLFAVAAALPLLTALGGVRSGLLQAIGAAARSQWPRLLVAPLFTLLLTVLVWWASGSVRALDLVLVTVLAAALATGINGRQVEARAARCAAPAVASTLRLRTSLHFMTVSGLYLLNSRLDVIMLGSLHDARDAGIYTIASRLADLTSFVMATVNMVIAPRIAELYQRGELSVLQRMVRVSARGVFLASLPAALLLVVAAQPLLVCVYGPEYAEGALPLSILVCAQMLVVGSGPLGLLLNMTGHEKSLTINMAISVAANATLNTLLIPRFGAVGAAIATGGSLVLSRILLWRSVRSAVNIRPTAY